MILISGLHAIWITIVFAILFLWIIKDEVSKFVIAGIYGCLLFSVGCFLDHGQEYEITLINQNKVKIVAVDSGRIYFCTPEKITETIDKDNL